jgi:DNA-directed RNA polymerase subunit K/omega
MVEGREIRLARPNPPPSGGYEEEITQPRSKYELIMMASAEASRLNEEVRRKGTKLGQKVTLEALKRVREGKVKAVITVKPAVIVHAKPLTTITVDSPDALFGNPPLLPIDGPDAPERPAGPDLLLDDIE